MTIADCEMTVSRSAISLVMVDECHSAGVLGETGRGITELYDLRGQVDILTGTLGKAFGGAVGGFTTGRSLPVSVRSLLPSTTAVWIETTVVVVIVVRHLGGVRAGLMGVALSALNTINCDRKSGKHTRE